MTAVAKGTLAGVFATRLEAERAVTALRADGFRDERIGFVGRNIRGEVERTTGAEESMAQEGATAGAIAGAGIGAAIGFGVLAGMIPVIGPAIVAGTLGTILTNAVGGAAVVGIVGALVGFGIPEEDAQYYEGEVQAGRYLVTVDAEGRAVGAQTILTRHGGYGPRATKQ